MEELEGKPDWRERIQSLTKFQLIVGKSFTDIINYNLFTVLVDLFQVRLMGDV